MKISVFDIEEDAAAQQCEEEAESRSRCPQLGGWGPQLGGAGERGLPF